MFHNLLIVRQHVNSSIKTAPIHTFLTFASIVAAQNRNWGDNFLMISNDKQNVLGVDLDLV